MAANLDQQYPEKPWLDIAGSNIFQAEKAQLKDIISLIDGYHALKKTDKSTLKDRIDKLDKIFGQINGALASENFSIAVREKLKQFAIQCNGKRIYLRALLNQEKSNPVKTTLRTIFGGVTEIPDLKGQKETYLLRTLRPLSMPGDVSAHSRDPLQRYPEEEFNKLLKQWDNELNSWLKRSNEASSLTGTFPSFFMWLEDKDSITQTLNTKPVHIKELMSVNKEVLHPRKYRFSDTGLILDKNNKPLASTENTTTSKESVEQEFIYAISPKGELYLSSQKGDDAEAIFHSDIINHHIPVICAGHIKIANGKITYIDNNSGHFQPTPFHMEQALRLLSSKNSFSPVAKVKVSYMTKEKHVESPECNINDFDSKKIPYTRQTRSVTENEFNALKQKAVQEHWPKEKLGDEWWKLGKPMTTEEINKKWGADYEEKIKMNKKHEKSDKQPPPKPANPEAANVTKYFQLWKKKVQDISAEKRKPKPKSDGPRPYK